MKIVFFEVRADEKEFLADSLKGNDVVFFEEKLSSKYLKLIEDVEILSVFVYSKVDSKILEKLKKLKAIVTRSTGFDHIDVKSCKKKNIKILNVPYYGENTVAEHTFALILDLSRKIHNSYNRTIRGNFSLTGLCGFDLKKKTIGIVGFGHIGKHVARIANGFEMKVLVYDPHPDKKLGVKLNVTYVKLSDLLKNSDIVSLHCPYNKKTKHLINEKNIGMMKKTAYLINTARGGIVKTKSLVSALANKKISGCALDVLEEEILIKEEVQLLSKNFPKKKLENLLQNHLLLTFDNVIITPHNAFNSKEALQRILDVTVEDIKCVLTKSKKGNFVK